MALQIDFTTNKVQRVSVAASAGFTLGDVRELLSTVQGLPDDTVLAFYVGTNEWRPDKIVATYEEPVPADSPGA